MGERKIRDIMLPLGNFPGVSPRDSFEKTVNELNKFLRTGDTPAIDSAILLVYENNAIIGIIRINDLIEAIEPQYLQGKTYRGWTAGNEWSIPVFWEGLFTERVREVMDGKTARDIMHPLEYEVEADDPMIKAVYGMARYSVNILPVKEDGLITGMVRSRELFQEISGLVAKDEAEVYALNRFIETGKKAGWVHSSAGGN
ncbi:response regulator receiver protein [Desulfocucumis palustris]|uniref:Response regulator receiver protein n=1 Tax=Desulfocucumis palustris TaxID=1898651 RepID=A0A2L2XEX5_9FIRM|nr:CBS domain-containing protein [Desulfocucumis palustris]GBF34564.1 response regulator receiver protein [Desulfocucumis palustris]